MSHNRVLQRKYIVYGIFNNITNKWYIGITRSPRKRYREHFNKLRKNKHHSQKLQASYNKHGLQVFEWRILEINILKKQVLEKEKQWIALFDSFQNGYNMNEGGGVINYTGWNNRPFIWNGIQYKSLIEAERLTGITVHVWQRRLSNGYSCDDDIVWKGGIAISCTWNGIEYKSIALAAKALGVSSKCLQGRLKQGYTCDDDVPPTEKITVWNGIEYPSINEAARSLGISRATMQERIARGYVCDDDIGDWSKSCVWNGVNYDSFNEMGKALGISRAAAAYRINLGYTCDEDLKPHTSKKCSWNGIEYDSIKDASIALGVTYITMLRRLKKGYTQDSDLKNKKKSML